MDTFLVSMSFLFIFLHRTHIIRSVDFWVEIIDNE